MKVYLLLLCVIVMMSIGYFGYTLGIETGIVPGDFWSYLYGLVAFKLDGVHPLVSLLFDFMAIVAGFLIYWLIRDGAKE